MAKAIISAPVIISETTIRRDAHGRYSLNDLHQAAMSTNKATESQRPGEFLRSDGVKRFVAAFDEQQETAGKAAVSAVSVKTGRNGGTYASELVAIRYAAWIDPVFEVNVYKTFQAVIKGKDDWRKLRHAAASSNIVLNGIIQDTRTEAGKETSAVHYMSEAKLVNWAAFGEFAGVERDDLSREQLDLLAHLETRNGIMIGRGLSYDERKARLPEIAEAWQERRIARMAAKPMGQKIIS